MLTMNYNNIYTKCNPNKQEIERILSRRNMSKPSSYFFGLASAWLDVNNMYNNKKNKKGKR